jgi:hypothetical protein
VPLFLWALLPSPVCSAARWSHLLRRFLKILFPLRIVGFCSVRALPNC